MLFLNEFLMANNLFHLGKGWWHFQQPGTNQDGLFPALKKKKSLFRSTSYWWFSVSGISWSWRGAKPLAASLIPWGHSPLTMLKTFSRPLPPPLRGFCQPVSGGCRALLCFTQSWSFSPHLTRPSTIGKGMRRYHASAADLGLSACCSHSKQPLI